MSVFEQFIIKAQIAEHGFVLFRLPGEQKLRFIFQDKKDGFVIEDGCRLARGTIDGRNLLEHFVAGVLVLTLLVPMVFAVFANEQNTVHGQIVAAQRQCVGDGRHYLHLWKSCGPFIGKVSLRPLIDVE